MYVGRTGTSIFFHDISSIIARLDARLDLQRIPTNGHPAPHLDKLWSPSYADATDEANGTWRNLFENPTSVQFVHFVLVLAMTIYLATALLFASTRRSRARYGGRVCDAEHVSGAWYHLHAALPRAARSNAPNWQCCAALGRTLRPFSTT
ncbi:hypothetical protein EDB87DRAFT_1661070 [Lactarius vividus]|nr:hypothetical protein EDB87DRAFT_1661070 [Lactarius vividus]